MKVTLKDGSVREYAQPMAVIDIAKDISEGLARNVCATTVNGEGVDIRTVIDKDSTLVLHTFDDQEGKAAILAYHIPHFGTGSEASVPGDEAGHRSVYRRGLLL